VPGRLADLRRRLRVEITDLLRAATSAEDGHVEPDGSMLLRLPAHVVGLDVHKQVRVRTGVALDYGDRTCIPLQWEAEPGRHAFPVFRGTIELEPMSSTSAQLAVVGAVSPPLGPVGAVAETTALGSIAERTAQHLADRLADALLAPAAGDDEDPEAAAAPAAKLMVRDVMTPDPLVLYEGMPVKTAALLLFHFQVSGAPVRTDDGGLVGVLSEADLLSVQAPPPLGLGKREAAARTRRYARTVGEACSRPAQVVAPDATVADAARLMWDHDIARLIVVAGAEIVGIVSRHDVLRAVVRGDAETQAAVDAALRELDEDTLGSPTVHIEWGTATITGELAYHSGVQRVLRVVADVDGVIGVESHLRWRDDDLVPPSIVP
jgi:CBS domain-containing protein